MFFKQKRKKTIKAHTSTYIPHNNTSKNKDNKIFQKVEIVLLI